jgi:hypothetical protein
MEDDANDRSLPEAAAERTQLPKVASRQNCLMIRFQYDSSCEGQLLHNAAS